MFKRKGANVFENHFMLSRFIKNFAYIGDKRNIIVETCEPKAKAGSENRNVISTLNSIKYDLLFYCLDSNTIIEIHKKFGRDKTDSILNKHSKKDGGPIDEIIKQIKTLRNINQSTSEETLAERVRQRAEKLKNKKKKD